MCTASMCKHRGAEGSGGGPAPHNHRPPTVGRPPPPRPPKCDIVCDRSLSEVTKAAYQRPNKGRSGQKMYLWWSLLAAVLSGATLIGNATAHPGQLRTCSHIAPKPEQVSLNPL